MICSALNGMMAVKHPTLGVLVREDVMVLTKARGKGKYYAYTKGSLYDNGYHYVCIRGKSYRVHRLVAETFIPNTDGKPTVDHINRNTSDNRVCNLRWATYKEQTENNTRVLNRADYGVRACDDKVEYQRNYREKKKQQNSFQNRNI